MTDTPLSSPQSPLSAPSRVEVRPARFGHGVYAIAEQPRGSLILQFAGRRLSGPELERQGFTPGYPLQVGDDDWLLLDSPGVYVNHSCSPNAGIDHALRLIALRDIAAGEEICFDYSTTMHEDDAWTLECGCGVAECRGVIRDFVTLGASLQQHYLSQQVVPEFIRRRLQTEEHRCC